MAGEAGVPGYLSAVSVGLQRFAEQPKYTEVNPGQDALLVCKVIDKRGVCSWQKDNKPVGIYPKKYEWASQYGIGQTAHVGGDCSLWVRAAQLEFDDGLWECQVTASDFTTQDALTSQPVRLVVRVPPQRPRLEHEGVHVPPGHNVTVDSGAVATVKCVSHYGNPPALLKWFLGDQEISPIHPQTNSTEPDNPRTWSAASVVQIPANKDRHGAMLKCLALHESYAARSVAVEGRLDVKYAPTVRLLGAPQIDLEEGKDSLILRCVADANPPASIVWRRAGRSEIASLQESLQLRPVGRRDAGLYTCQAQNSVGTSDTMSVQLDVKYAPKILSAGPDRLTTAPLFSPAAFECVAEGNPAPTYKWVQRISSQGKPFLDRGRESRLVIDNVTYDYQGEYECRATNFINGQERTATSDPIALQVVGAPQVLRTTSASGGAIGHSVSVKKGDSATLSLIVCADPRPRHVAWEWGSLRLEAGSGIGRYRVDDVTQDSREDCYLATLHIEAADLQDQRPYYLVVENERGTDRHAINLRVEGMFSVVEPLELSYLLGIAGGCLAAFLILICLCIYVVRARKCCFRNRNNYKTSEKDSEKADLKSRSDSLSGPPLDSIYTTPTGFHHHQHHPHHPHHAAHHHAQQPNGTPGSPEAMKTPNSETDGTVKDGQLSAAGLEPTASDADLVLSTLRHQRDLFSGPLGIPDVTTRVGSVIHAFETMARQRQSLGSQRADKPYDSAAIGADRSSRYRSHRSNVKRVGDTATRHKIILPSPKVSPAPELRAANPNHHHYQPPHHHHHLPPASFSYTDPQGFGLRTRGHLAGGALHNTHFNNTNHSEHNSAGGDHNNHGSHTVPRVSAIAAPGNTNTLAVAGGGGPPYRPHSEHDSNNFDSLNLDDDYRKSSFGKQSKLVHHPPQQQHGLARNQHEPPGGSAGTRGTRGLWGLFGGAGSVAPDAGYSSSRNNPNVFFNATSPSPAPAVVAGGTSIPSAAATGSIGGAATMRYYNHDNSANGGNRRSAILPVACGESLAQYGDGRDRRYDADDDGPDGGASFAHDGDNEVDDNHVSGDKFLRGSTVSQSFIKNVRIIRKRSSSYDVNSAAPGGPDGPGGRSNSASTHRKDTGKRNDGPGTNGTAASSANGFKQRGSQMMAAAAKHFTKRHRAPQPSASIGTVADTDELTGTLRPAPTEDGTGEPAADDVSGAAASAQRASGGSGRRRLFQPRTMDRAEI
ncbi:uncharacterized protein LOC131207508 [Anopheles bellator]|uniref:uncharacterized protein LOC131207508 n=1 Tax=Anopheles bellator TaxID=139047 RepID=UPI0026495F57|nr:uncharacterized protein LOC131207508 [Anopheles bellator]